MIRTVGNYKLLQELGEGAMGTVYRALDVQLEREVALKSLRSELARRPDIVDRFREEAKLQGKLENIHIVRLYQFLREGNEFFMVMEFVKGFTLSQLLRERRKLPPNEAISIMEQALAGLGYAHKRNIVHRDIKPANIMINEDEIVKVADFGIARLVGSARQTKLGSIVGTLEYISPEAVQGNDATAVSDIYSCGILLYELLSGRLPFESANEYELARAQVKDKPPPLRQLVPDVPARLEKAVMRALAKKPSERFQSAAQMAQELKSCFSGQSGAEPHQEKSFWNKLWSSSGSEVDETQVLSGLPSSSPELRRQSPLLESDDSSLRLRNTALQDLSRQVDDFLNQRNWIRAKQEVEKMTSLYPREPALVEMTNRITREQRHYDEALQMALREAQNLLDRRLPQDAKRAIELSLQRFPAEAELSALLLRAEAELAAYAVRSAEADETIGRVEQLLTEARYPEAIAASAEAVARFPNQPDVTALLGRAVKAQKVDGCRQTVDGHRRTSQWDAALKAIDQTLALYRDEPALVELRQGVLEERECERQSKEAGAILARAAELQKSGQPDAAESAVNDALARFTKIPAELSGKLAETAAALKRARHEKIGAAAIAEARSLEKGRQWQRAIDVLNAAMSRVPGIAAVEETRKEIEQARDRYTAGLRQALADGRALLDANRFEDALVSLNASAQNYPGEGGFKELLLEAQQKLTAERRERQLNAARTKAVELLRDQSFEEGEHFLLDAISQFPDDPRLTDLLSAAIQGRREQEKKRTVERALASARQYAKQKLYQDGIHALDEALAAYPGEQSLEALKQELTHTLREVRRTQLVSELKGWAGAYDTKFDQARSALDRALAEYPNDTELTSIRGEIATAQRAFDRAAAERDAAARSAEFEKRGRFDDALALADAALAKYPESESLARLREEIERRGVEADRLRQAADAERNIRRLLVSGNPHAASEPMNAALDEFPEHEGLRQLSAGVAAAVHEFDAQAAARQVHDAMANRNWTAAEDAVARFETSYGSDATSAGLKDEIARARQARRKTLDEASARARAGIAASDFVAAIGVIEALKLNDVERAGFDELLARARSGLENQLFQKRFQELRDKVSSALERGDLNAALKLVADAKAEYEKYPAFIELDAKVRRERDISAALDKALELVGARQWTEAIDLLEAKIKEFGKDRRFSDLIAQIQQERKSRRKAADAAIAEAHALFEAGQHDRSIRRLTQAAAEFPEQPSVAEALDKTRQDLGAISRESKLREVEDLARSLLAANQPADAETLLGQALRDHPGNPALADLLSEARAARARLDEIKSRVESIQAALKASDATRAEALLREALEKFPGEAVLENLEAVVADEGLLAALIAARRQLAAGRNDDAKALLAAAVEKYGQNPKLTDFAKQIEEAEQKRATIDRAIAVAGTHLDAGRVQEALAILDKLPAWVSSDPATVEFRERCQRMLAWQKEEFQKISARVEALGQKGLYDDAVTLLESASSEPHLQPVLLTLLERFRKLQLSAAQQLSKARQARTETGPSAALELMRQAGAETRRHPDFGLLQEQFERELRAAAKPTRVTPLPLPPPPAPPRPVAPAEIPQPARKFPPAAIWGGLAVVAIAVGLLVKSMLAPSTPHTQPAGSSAPASDASPTQASPAQNASKPAPAKSEPSAATLSVARSEIQIDYKLGNPFPAPQRIIVHSSAEPTPFAASVTQGKEWLSVSQDDTTAPTTLTVTFKILGLRPGSHAGTIRCVTNAGKSATIAVNLTIPAAVKTQ